MHIVKKRSKTLKKLLANFKKVSIMHFRCHARQQRKKLQASLKSSLKISTDNLCGPSEKRVKKQE